MNKPTCALWDKDYADQWKAWIIAEVEENQFETIEDCMKHVMTKANGRCNPTIVKEIYLNWCN